MMRGRQRNLSRHRRVDAEASRLLTQPGGEDLCALFRLLPALALAVVRLLDLEPGECPAAAVG